MKGAKVPLLVRVKLRETGSILVQAPEEEVLRVLSGLRGAARVAPDRVQVPGATYVVRGGRDATRVVESRTSSAAVALATRDREEIRKEVESDLFRLQRMFTIQ